MKAVTTEQIQRAIAVLGDGERRDAEIDVTVSRFAPDRDTMRRLVDVIPEAFGLVLLPQVADVVLPATFTARAHDGAWKTFAMDREPIFAEAGRLAREMYADNPRGAFSRIAKRSSLIVAVDKALNDGASLDGATLSGPAFIGIPAETYDDAKPGGKATSFWRKLVG